MAYKAVIKQGSLVAGWSLLLAKASLYKVSYIVGSAALFFSGTSLVGPLLGAYATVQACSAVFIIRLIIGFILKGSFSAQLLALYVPGLAASISWSQPSYSTKVLLPIACMILFVMHPSGYAAWVYTLYWLIPVGLYLFDYSSIFSQALSATFIAHAVGSVIWQYTVAMTPAVWLLLVPLVFVERIVFASAMTVLYYGVYYSFVIIRGMRHRLLSVRVYSSQA